jgi:hypothetical protein
MASPTPSVDKEAKDGGLKCGFVVLCSLLGSGGLCAVDDDLSPTAPGGVEKLLTGKEISLICSAFLG